MVGHRRLRTQADPVRRRWKPSVMRRGRAATSPRPPFARCACRASGSSAARLRRAHSPLLRRLQAIGGDFTIGEFPKANHTLVETQTGLTSEMLVSDRFAPGSSPRATGLWFEGASGARSRAGSERGEHDACDRVERSADPRPAQDVARPRHRDGVSRASPTSVSVQRRARARAGSRRCPAELGSRLEKKTAIFGLPRC